MIEFAGSPGNGPFTIALIIMLLLGLFEVISTLFGSTLSGMLDSLLPDVNIDAEVGPEVEGPGLFTQSLSWLGFGVVPFLILLIIFLTCFGLVGLTVQYTMQSITGSMLPAWLATLPALLISTPLVRWGSKLTAMILPQEETSAVSINTLTARQATITQGEAKRGLAAEAKVEDQHGNTHYVLVEPDSDDISLPRDSKIVLVEHIKGKRFKAVPFEQ